MIDPSDEKDVNEVLLLKNWDLNQIVNTHHHFDHTNGNLKLKNKWKAELIGPEEEKDKIKNIDRYVSDGDKTQIAGLDALVCSPLEVSAVRKIFKKEIITPGVQIGKRNYDQKRSMEAKKVKSDWLVIGRAVTQGNIKKNIRNLTKELR